MAIPYFPSSGRRPHFWRIRADGWREFLLSRGWVMCGAWSVKHIGGREVIVTIAEKHDDHYLCRFQLKNDVWAKVTADFREREASQRRNAFEVVGADASDSEWSEDAEAVGIGTMFASSREFERMRANAPDYLDSAEQILADRTLQRDADGLLLDRGRQDRLAREFELCLDRLRSAVPNTEYVDPILDYLPGTLYAEFYPRACSRFLEQAYKKPNGDPRCGEPAFDSLADRLDLWRVDFHGEATLELHVRAYFSVTHAVAALEALPGVISAEVVDEGMEDQPDIAIAPAEPGAFAVVVRGRYNERTFSTTARGYRFFLVSAAGVTQVSAQNASRSAPFREAVADRPWRRKLRWPARIR